MKIREVTVEEWEKEGTELFGPDKKKWRFVCPLCRHEASVQDWLDHNGQTLVAFSCVGRLTGEKREAFEEGKGPCNYAGGGLFKLNPVHVKSPEGTITQLFEFAKGNQSLPSDKHEV